MKWSASGLGWVVTQHLPGETEENHANIGKNRQYLGRYFQHQSAEPPFFGSKRDVVWRLRLFHILQRPRVSRDCVLFVHRFIFNIYPPRFNFQGQSYRWYFLSRLLTGRVLHCHSINVTSATCFDLIKLSSGRYFYLHRIVLSNSLFYDFVKISSTYCRNLLKSFLFFK
jgi:hypothetical protein